VAYRFTNTDKWNDAWFSSLSPSEKLLFDYLCDICDIAGFAEMILKKWSADTGIPLSEIKGALKGLQRGLVFSGDCIYVKNFLKHQKNLPINPNNPAHKGILKRFELYSDKFKIENIEDFLKAPSKPLDWGIGNGNGNGSGNGKGKLNVDFETFWNLYDKKVGDKKRCEKKWTKLKDSDREEIIKTLPAFKSHIKDKQFQPYPETYLNQRRWEDEITENYNAQEHDQSKFD